MYAKTTKEIAGYVGRTYKFGGDTRLAVENGEAPIFSLPPDPPAGCSKGVEKLWEKELDDNANWRTQLGHNLRQLFALVWGQCTEILQQRLGADEGFASMSTTNDGLLLIKAIKNINYHHQSHKYTPHSIFEAKKRFYIQFQEAKVSTNDYFKQFMNTVKVIGHSGGSVWNDKGIKAIVLKDMKKTSITAMDEAEKKTFENDVKERTLAVAFLLSADRMRFGKLVEDMENSYLQGNNKYPTTIIDAHHLLANWKHDSCLGLKDVIGGEINFLNADREKQFTKAKAKVKEVTCYRCQQPGHLASKCDNERVERVERIVKDEKQATRAQAGTTLLNCTDSDKDEEYTHFQFLNNGKVKGNSEVLHYRLERTVGFHATGFFLTISPPSMCFATRNSSRIFASIPIS